MTVRMFTVLSVTSKRPVPATAEMLAIDRAGWGQVLVLVRLRLFFVTSTLVLVPDRASSPIEITGEV